jgi:hypothetical protein
MAVRTVSVSGPLRPPAIIIIIIIYLFIYLFTAIGFAPGGSSPTLVQTNTIKQHCAVVQHTTNTTSSFFSFLGNGKTEST